MPIPFIAEIASRGISAVPHALPILKTLPWILLIWLLKIYFAGGSNNSHRLMRSKVILISGGTSGIGATIARDLAKRGAQIILLTQHSLSDAFLVEYLEDLRRSTQNQFIYAEQVDFASLHSIRTFATKWVDNAPPRRLDAIILCADTITPRFGLHGQSQDLLEPVWAINFLANFHLLGILSPALRNQPPDRDVRIVLATCSSYVGGNLTELKNDQDPLPERRRYETSKLSIMVFAHALQKHLNDFKRPDQRPNNARVILVDPGYSRTPGMRRWLTQGSLWGLLLYLASLPFWWLVLKSPEQGAQGFLRAIMDEEFGRGMQCRFLKECREAPFSRAEITDEEVQKKLWEFSETQIQVFEKQSATRRAREKSNSTEEK